MPRESSRCEAQLWLLLLLALTRTTYKTYRSRSQTAQAAIATNMTSRPLLRSSSGPLPQPSRASSTLAAASCRLNLRSTNTKGSHTAPARDGERLERSGKVVEAEVSLVVVYAAFTTSARDQTGEGRARRCSDDTEDTTTTTPDEPSSPCPLALSPLTPSVVLPSPPSSPRAPPSSPTSRALALPLLTEIGIDLARCRLRVCTCSPDYDSGETTSSDDDDEEEFEGVR